MNLIIKTTYCLIICCLTLAGCRNKNIDEQTRRIYLREHVNNCNYLTGRYFSDFEQYRVIDKETKNYEKLENAINACREFNDFLNKDLYLNLDSGLIQNHWRLALEKQQKISDEIDNIQSPFISRVVRQYKLEKILPSDTDELKIAKYFSNSECLTRQLHYGLEYTKRYAERNIIEFLSLLTIIDTIQLGDTLITTGGIYLQEDVRNSIIIEQMNDCKLISINFSTKKFKLEITGPNPSVRFAYFDSFQKQDRTHEIIF